MVSPVTMTRAQGWGSPTGLQHLLGVNPLSGYLPPLGDLTEVHLAALAGDTGRMKAAIAFHGQTLDDRDGGNRTALHFACVNGHQEIVIQLVGAKCKLNLCDSENRTPLIKAVQCQQEACATILLQHRADPNVMDIYGSTALHYAVYRQNLSIAAKLLSYNADIEATNKEGFTPLLLAVGNNKQQMVSFLIKSGANVHAVDTMKRTTLMLAVSYKAPNTIKLLLQQGVDVFCQDSLGKTVKDHAFHYDFKINQEIISEYLAERTSQMKNQGVNANFGEASLCSNSQLTPEDLIEERTNNSRNNNQGDCRKRRMSLSVASLKTIGTKMKQYLTFWYSKNPEESYSVNPLSGYTIHTKDLKEIHKVAIEGDRVKMDHIISFQSFTLNERDKNQRTALHFACVNGHRDIVMQLVDAKCKLNLCDSENRTPLIKAVQCQQKECASILLQNHACPNLLDICSNTALHYATCSQNIEIAAELLSFNADIEATNKDGFTPLLLAVSKNNQQMVEFLINKGANVHALDASKRTSLMIAVSIEAPDIIRLLLQQGVSVFCQDASGQTAKDHAAHYGFKINHKLISEYLTEKMTNFSSQNNNQGVAMLAETSLNSNYQRLSQDKVGQAIKNNSQNNSQGGEKSKESSLSSLSVKADTDDSWPTSNDDLLFEPKTCLEPSLAQQWSAFHQFKEKIGANCNTTGVENRIVLEDISFEDEIDDEIETVLKPSSVQEIPHPDIPSSDCSTVQHPPNSSVICGLTNEETAKEACRNEKSGSHITDSASAQQTNHDNLTCADEEHKSSRYDMNPALGFGEEEDTESSCESQNVCKNAAQMHIGHLSGSVDERGKHILNQQKYGGNDKSKETSLSSLSRIPNTNDSWSSSDDDFNFEPTSVVNADFSKRVAVRHQFKEKSGGAVCDTVRVENTTLLEDSHSARGNEDKTETPVRPSVQQISHPDISLPECSTLPSHPKSSAICYLANGEATKQASRNEEAVVIIENTPQEQRSEDSLISTHETHKNSRCGMDSALEPGEEKDSESPCNSKKICENTGQNYVSHLPGASDLRGKDICTQENGGVDKFTETSPNRVPDTDDSWSSSDDDLNSELKIVQNPDFSKQTSVTHQFKEKYFTMVEANCYIVKAENRALFTDSHSAGGNDDGIETPVKPSIQEISHPDISSLTLSTFPNPPKPLAVCHLANGEATKQATGNEENAITIIENAAQEKGNNNLIFVDEARISRCGMNSALGPGGKKDSESSFNSEKICKNAAQKSVDNLFGTLDQRGKQTLNAQDDIGANCDTKRAENRTLLEDSSSDGENDDEIETFLKPPVQEISPPDIRSPDLFTLPSHPRSIAICYVPNTNCENAAQNYVGDLSGATDQSEKHRLNGQEDDLSTDQDSSKAERDQESLDASEINHPQRNRKIQKKRRRQHRTRASSSAVVLPCGAKTQAWAVDMVEAKKKQKRKSNEVEVSKSLYDASGDNHGVIQQRRSGKPGGHLFPFLETKDSNSGLALHMNKVQDTGMKCLSKKPVLSPTHKKSALLTDDEHQDRDDSSLSEVDENLGRSVKKTSKENKAKRQIKPADVLDFLTQSSETASEDSELPYSNYRNAIFLTEQLGLGGKDSVNVSKKGETLLFYKRLLELNRYHYELLAQKNERRKAKVSGLLKLLSESKEIQSQLKHQKEEWEQELYTVRSTLKKEEEKRRTTDLLCEELRQQLRKTIGQNSKEVEVRQQLELTLQSLNRELSALRNELNQVTEERDDSQRQLAVEQNARALQERIAKDHYSRQKDLEESYKKVKSMVSEGGKKEKDLLHKNHMLQDRVSILKQELRKLSHQGQEKERKYFEDIKVLQEKNHALQDTIEQNEEASTEKIIQYTRQLDALKAENITLNTTLEDEKQNKARLETEVESYCSRLAAVLCNQDPSQTSRNDLEVTFQRAKDEWLNLQDHLTFQVSSLKASNKILSQQLFKAESKSNSLETELQHTGDALRQKTSTVECLQKELCRIHCQKKELEREYDNQQNLLNEHIRKQESLEGQLSEIQNENVLLQCQLDAAHSKASKKEKTVMSIHDGFWDVKRRNQAEPEDQCLTQEERNKELINECNCSKQTVCPCENEKAQREELVRKLEQELAGSRKKQSTAEVVSYYLIKLEDERRDFKKKVDDLTSELQIASSKCLHLDAHNQVLQQEISYMTATRKKCGKLKKHNSELEQEIVNLKSHIGKMMEKYGQVEQSKRELEERSRHNLAEILRAVELFLQKRASSPRYVEQRKENGTASMSNQVDLRVKNLESEFSKMKISHEVSKEAEIEKCKVQIEYLISELSTVKMSQEMSKKAQLGKYEPLFIEEVKVKNSLENKPKWTHEHPAVKFGAKFVEKDLNKPLLFTLPTRPGLNPLLVGSPNYTSLTFNRNCFSRETFAGSTSSLRPSFNSKENCYLTKMEEALDVSTAGEVAEGVSLHVTSITTPTILTPI